MNILTVEQLQNAVPSIFESGTRNVSAKYAKINTIDVVNVLRDSGFYPVKASQQRKLDQNNRPFAKHVLRFRSDKALTRENNVGDSIPELVLMNSHDGSSAYKMMFGIFRLVCSNGLVVASSTVAGISVRHSGDPREVFNRITQSAKDITAQSDKVFERVSAWQGKTLDINQSRSFAEGAAAIYTEGTENKIEPERILKPRRWSEMGKSDLWTAFNIVQENFTKGGFYQQNAQGFYRRARALSSIDRDVKLNKALWEYTDKFYSNN